MHLRTRGGHGEIDASPAAPQRALDTLGSDVVLRADPAQLPLGQPSGARRIRREQGPPQLLERLPGRSHILNYFVVRTGVAQVNLSQNGPLPRWKRPAHPLPPPRPAPVVRAPLPLPLRHHLRW
jgi:hypothetical protein